MTNFTDALTKRRSIYALGKNTELNEDQIVALVKEVVRQSPTAFNSQTQRVVVLFGDNHEKVWDITEAALKPLTPPEAFPNTQAKLAGFKAAKGTILFFEDQDVVKALQEQFELYAENFPVWSEQSTGISSVNVWTALAQENIGANLQHYNPVIDEEVAKAWDIPASWKLRGQLVFGSIEAGAGEKEFMEDDERFRIFK